MLNDRKLIGPLCCLRTQTRLLAVEKKNSRPFRLPGRYRLLAESDALKTTHACRSDAMHDVQHPKIYITDCVVTMPCGTLTGVEGSSAAGGI